MNSKEYSNKSQDRVSAGFRFDNSYLNLPDGLFAKVLPTPVSQPIITIFNSELAKELELNAEILIQNGAEYLSGNKIFPGSMPFSQAYAGHQFGHFVILGDGRAIILGEHVTSSKQRIDIQLKGSGPTKYSRRGDGRAVLGPMLREYIISEAMHAHNIATTRSLAVLITGETVYREGAETGAILCRTASSHIRVGTFEFAAIQDNPEILKKLADYTINRHFPQAFESSNAYLEFLKLVISRQAKLLAKWMLLGFIHGVMNSDNMSICGETIDYGPCAFMDRYDPDTVFSSIDRAGRYAYANQPLIAQWNLTRLAESLLPLLDKNIEAATELAQEAVSDFSQQFKDFWLAGMRSKLGLFNQAEDDLELFADLLNWMHKENTDYTNTFLALSDPRFASLQKLDQGDFIAWQSRWQNRLKEQSQSMPESKMLMQKSNPVLIPRNHLVEEALSDCSEKNDYSKFLEFLELLKTPYNYERAPDRFNQPDSAPAGSYKTFCGT